MEPISRKKQVEEFESIIAQLHKIILDDCYDKLVNPLAWRVQLLERKFDVLERNFDRTSIKDAKSELKEFRKYLQYMKGWRKDGE